MRTAYSRKLTWYTKSIVEHNSAHDPVRPVSGYSTDRNRWHQPRHSEAMKNTQWSSLRAWGDFSKPCRLWVIVGRQTYRYTEKHSIWFQDKRTKMYFHSSCEVRGGDREQGRRRCPFPRNRKGCPSHSRWSLLLEQPFSKGYSRIKPPVKCLYLRQPTK